MSSEDERKSRQELINELDEMRGTVKRLSVQVFGLARAEEALKVSEEKYRLLVDNLDYPLTVYDREGRIIFLNTVGARNFGITQDEVAGKSLYDLFPYQADLFIERARKVYDSGTGLTVEDEVPLPDGVGWFYSNIQPVRNPEGEIIAVQSISYDITGRKQSEQEMSRLRNLLSNIVNSMPSILIGVDIEGHIVQWNTAAEQATGVIADDAEGKPLTDVFPRMTAQMKTVHQSISDRETIRDEKVSRQRDGETRLEDITVYPLVVNGTEGAVIRIDDVTDRVRIEEMIVQSEKMLSVGGLAAGMAHDINNPIAGILQNIQVIRNRLIGDLPSNQDAADKCSTTMETIGSYVAHREIPKMIQAVIDSGQRAAEIIDNILSFSRKRESIISTENLTTLMDRTVALASTTYDLLKHTDFRNIEIVREYIVDSLDIKCDGSSIQQVFLNILTNGAQAMFEAGIPAPCFTLRIRQDGETAIVEIEDNGPGMTEEVRNRAFEPFFTTKDVGVGTGLGLSVSYFIITQNHGGKLTVESAPDQGATFIIQLPI